MDGGGLPAVFYDIWGDDEVSELPVILGDCPSHLTKSLP